jgi:endonuclease/exonuclease/phosphatase family metal-dependent hydrolase
MNNEGNRGRMLQGIVDTVTQPLIAVSISFLLGAVVMLVIGKNPLLAYGEMIRGAFGKQVYLMNTLKRATPIIMGGLAVCMAWRSGYEAMGGEGQMILGAVAAALVGYYLPVPGWLRIPAAGALYSAFSELCALTANDTSGGILVEKSARDGILANTSLEAGADVRVMSSNVLGTRTGSGYECPNEVRAAIMAEYILAYSPDSVGFQEFYGDVASIIKSDLAKKYQTVNFDGGMTATMYLKDKYTVVDKKVISTRVEETAGDSKAQNYTFTWVLLEDAEGERYIHANLHLEYRSDALRLEQCDMINAELDKVLAKYPDAALVITGDYNSKISDGSPIFDAIKGKTESDAGLSIECAELCAPEGKRDDDRSSYHSVCSHADIVTGTPSALDHIMVSTDTVDVKLHKIIYDALICHASDHCPVIIDFARKNV